MLTLANNIRLDVKATDVRFNDKILCVSLSDGREVRLPIERIEWLHWLAKATPEQRKKWSIEPGGFAIYWDDLDDGVEVCHLLAMQTLV